MGAFLDPLLACPAIENQFRRHCKTSGQKGQILKSMLLNEKTYVSDSEVPQDFK